MSIGKHDSAMRLHKLVKFTLTNSPLSRVRPGQFYRTFESESWTGAAVCPEHTRLKNSPSSSRSRDCYERFSVLQCQGSCGVDVSRSQV